MKVCNKVSLVSDYRPRTAYTLVEVLVAIGIAAVLLAILIPAVQRVRMASSRVDCANKLRQIGLGTQQYHEVYGVFPPGNNRGYSVFVALLPYLEQSSILDQVDVSGYADDTSPIAQVRLSIVLCPVDPTAAGSGFGRTNFVGNIGTGLHVSGEPTGIFLNIRKCVGIKDVRDGLSNTAAFSESLVGDGSWDSLRTVFETPTGFAYSAHEADFCRTCEDFRKEPGRGDPTVKGSQWFMGAHGYSLYNHIQGPNRVSCTNDGDVYTGAYAPSSLHSGGVNVALADGSTRFISDSVDFAVWRGLGTRVGNEVLGDF